MDQLQHLIEGLVNKADNPKQTVHDSIEKHGKKAIGTLPIYAPEEIIYAAGYIPVGLWGGNIKSNKFNKYYPQFCCSIIKADTELALNGHYDCLDAIITSAFCDTLKCATEIFKIALPETKIIPFVYPQNRKAQSGREYMIAEYKRLQSVLECVSGKKITDEAFAESLSVYKKYRKEMREFTNLAGKHTDIIDSKTRHNIIKAAFFMDKSEYTEIINKINLKLSSYPVTLPERKVILTGLLSEPVKILEILNDNGLYVAADDLAQESRQFRTPDNDSDNIYEYLAERLALQDGCAFLYDSTKSRLDEIKKMVRAHNADVVVYLQMKFCDPDEFDYPIIEKGLQAEDIPVLHIELEQQMESFGQIITRIQGFIESMT